MSEFVTKQIVAAQVLAQDLVTKLREHAEEGQAMVEYGLILSFVSIVAIAALTHLGHDISKFYKHVADALSAAAPKVSNNN